MNLKSVLAAAVIVSSAVLNGAQAAPLGTWTWSEQGIISSGMDYSGVFGEQGADLTGLQFTKKFTSSIDPSMYSAGLTSYPVASRVLGDTVFPITVSLTVNNKTWGTTLTYGNWGEHFISNGLSSQNGFSDYVYSINSGTDVINGDYVSIIDSISSADIDGAFAPLLDFSQTMTANGNIQNTYSYVYLIRFGIEGQPPTTFTSYLTSIEINGVDASSDVPEPGSIALLGFGFAGMAALRRRKSKL